MVQDEGGKMAVKTITIDTEAYEILAAEKNVNESFSKVIKRRLRPSSTAATLLAHLNEICLSEDSLRHVEKLVKERRKSMADSPLL